MGYIKDIVFMMNVLNVYVVRGNCLLCNMNRGGVCVVFSNVCWSNKRSWKRL